MRVFPALPINPRVAAVGSLGFGILAALAAARLPLPQWTLPHLPALHLPELAALQAATAGLDTTVVLIFVPVCALMFAIVAEAMRLVSRNAGPDEATPFARAIPHWEDD